MRRLKPEGLDRPPAEDVLSKDQLRVLEADVGVPHVFRIRDHYRAVPALVQTTGMIHPDLRLEFRLKHRLLEEGVDIRSPLMGTRSSGRAHEDVNLEGRHGGLTDEMRFSTPANYSSLEAPAR
jgi:hypothetical protein